MSLNRSNNSCLVCMQMPLAGEAQMRLKMLHRITEAFAARKQIGVEGR